MLQVKLSGGVGRSSVRTGAVRLSRSDAPPGKTSFEQLLVRAVERS